MKHQYPLSNAQIEDEAAKKEVKLIPAQIMSIRFIVASISKLRTITDDDPIAILTEILNGIKEVGYLDTIIFWNSRLVDELSRFVIRQAEFAQGFERIGDYLR